MNNLFLYSEENKGIFNNGNFIIAYKLTLPEKYALGQEDYINLNFGWNNTLKNLQENTIFYKQDVFIESDFSTAKYPNNNFLQTDTKNYFNKWKHLKHTSYIFFILPTEKVQNINLSNPFNKVHKATYTEFDANIETFIQNVNSVILSLEAIQLKGNNRIKIHDLPNNQLVSYFDQYFNLFDTSHISDITVSNEHIQIGDKYASIVALLDEQKLPDTLNNNIKDKTLSNDKTNFFRNYAENFTYDLDFSHIYNQIIIIDPKKKHLNELKKRNVQLHKMKGFDAANQLYSKLTDEIIEHITINDDTINLVRAHNNIIIISKNLETLQKNTLKTIEAFNELQITPYRPIGNQLNALFLYSFPLFTNYFNDNQLYISSLEICCSFIANTGEYHDDDTGVLYNSRLSNIPVRVDTWDDKKENIVARNFFIIAPSGKGKSVNANHVIRHYMEQGTKVIIIDLGGSYRKLAALYPDQTTYIKYEENTPIGLNPFEIKNNEKISTDKIEQLVNFISFQYKRDIEITELEKTSLRKILEHFYNTAQKHSMISFIQFVKNNKLTLLDTLDIETHFFNISEFIHSMSEFLENGIYSYLYKEDKNTVGTSLYDKDLIVFELDAVKNNKLLLPIMLELISTTINTVIWEDKSTKGIVLFDEVAEQLTFPNVLKMIAYFFQAIRKQGSSVGIILQAISQLPDNEISKSIIENTQILYILYANDYRALQNRFQMSEHAYNQLCSLQSNFNAKVPYSEIFIMRGNKHQIYRLILPKKVYWAYQTEGIQNNNLMNIFKETGNMEQAINNYINLNN